MSTKPSICQDPFPLTYNNIEYYLLSKEHASVAEFDGQSILKAGPQTLTLPAQQAFHDAVFMLCVFRQQQVASILPDPETGENDKYVASQFLCDSEIAAKGTLPTCQDIGAAIIMGEKGQCVWTGDGDEAVLAQGIYDTYAEDNLRHPQNVPLGMYKEVSIDTNLPAQIGLYSVDGEEYKFLCMAKDGGSANKTYFYQETKASIIPTKLKNHLAEKMRTSGTAVCSSYHIVSVIGDTSVEATLETTKLASTRYYNGLLTEGNEHGQAFRDIWLKQKLLQGVQSLGLGAQFGRRCFAHDTWMTHLPRHGVPHPTDMGVSYSIDRNIKTRINRDGIWIRKLESNSGKYTPEHLRQQDEGNVVSINLNQPMSETLAQLSAYLISTRLGLNGTITVARDITHAKLRELIDNDEMLPQRVKDHPIYYAGPAETPAGHTSGSFGPTTVDHMDSYVDLLQSYGVSMVMPAKGNCSQQVTDACHKHGDFYLGNTSGPAVMPAQQNTKSLECVAYPGLGTETIWRIEVGGFLVLILVDNKGNGFFRQIQNKQCVGC